MDISSERGSLRLNPLAPLPRPPRRLRRRPAAMQVRTILVIVGRHRAPGGLAGHGAFWGPGCPSSAGAAEVPQHAFSPHSRPRPVPAVVASARPPSTSRPPWWTSTACPDGEEFASDKEYGQQINAIHLFVNQINQSGGINGRKINPIISSLTC